MNFNIIDEKKSLAFWYSIGITPGNTIPSPFRSDSNPSFAVFLDNKTYIWKGRDFATGRVYSPYEARELLGRGAFDIQVPEHIKKVAKSTSTSSKFLYIVPDEWRYHHKKYWEQYHINPDLYPIVGLTPISKAIMVYDRQSTSTLPVDTLSFAYKFPSHRVKIYNPYSTKCKWVGNTNVYDVYGIDSISGKDSLIITSSAKDLLVLKTYLKDYDIVAPNGEGYSIPYDLISKYTNVYLWYDNDEAGIKYANKWKQQYPHIQIIQQPKYKDPSDWIANSKEEFYEYVQRFMG